MAYEIVVERVAVAALEAISARDRGRLGKAILVQLSHQPTVETRNRKRMQPGGPADWEVRVPPYRIYYDVDEAARIVAVVAIARKERALPRSLS